MKTGKQTVILQLTKSLDSEEYKKLYFNLRRQIWSGILLLPPDIEFKGVSDPDADTVFIEGVSDPNADAVFIEKEKE